MITFAVYESAMIFFPKINPKNDLPKIQIILRHHCSLKQAGGLSQPINTLSSALFQNCRVGLTMQAKSNRCLKK